MKREYHDRVSSAPSEKPGNDFIPCVQFSRYTQNKNTTRYAHHDCPDIVPIGSYRQLEHLPLRQANKPSTERHRDSVRLCIPSLKESCLCNQIPGCKINNCKHCYIKAPRKIVSQLPDHGPTIGDEKYHNKSKAFILYYV